MGVSVQMFPLPQRNRTAGIFSRHRQLLPLPQSNQTAVIFSRHRLLPLQQWNRTAEIFPVIGICSLSLNGIKQQGLFPVIGCSLSHNGIGQPGFYPVIGNCSLSRNRTRQQGFFSPSSPTVPTPAIYSYIPRSLFVPESSLDSLPSQAEELHTPPAFRGQFSVKADWPNLDNETYSFWCKLWCGSTLQTEHR